MVYFEMKEFWNLRVNYWLRVILLFCGLLASVSVLINYQNVGSDFSQDYIAANSLRRGGSLYGEDITKLERELSGFGGIQNFHPPFNALLFLPLSLLPYKTAYIFLGIISITLLLLINKLVVRELKLNGEWFLNFTCFTLCWYPFICCLGTGQSSMIIAACLIGGWFCLRSKKTYVAGFLFAIATLMKLFPGLVLLYLFISKNWRAFFAMVFFIIIGLFATAVIVGFDDMRIYSILVIAKDVEEYAAFVFNHSISGIINRLFGERSPWTEPLAEIPQISSFMILISTAVVLIYTIHKMYKMVSKQEVADYAFALTLAAMLLLSPLTWSHIFPVLILPMGLLLREYIDEPSPKKMLLLLCILIFLSLPDVPIARGLMVVHHPFRMPWYSMLLTVGPGSGVVLLWIVLTRRTKTNNL